MNTKKKEVLTFTNDQIDIKQEVSIETVDSNIIEYARKSATENQTFILRENTGTEYRTDQKSDLSKIFSSKNITEIVIEEVHFDGAKRQVFQLKDSFANKQKILENQENPILKIVQDKKNIILDAEKFLNANQDLVSKKEEALFLKQQFVKRTNAIYQNFFKIKKNSDVFKVGKSYLEDFNLGKRCFGFTAAGDFKGAAKSMYGVAAFFNFYNHTRTLILASNEEVEHLRSLIDFTGKELISDNTLGIEYEVLESEGISVINYETLMNQDKAKTYDLVDKLVKLAGVTLCSLPVAAIYREKLDFYFQISQRLDNYSIIVKRNSTNIKLISETVSDFSNYNIPLKGVIVGG